MKDVLEALCEELDCQVDELKDKLKIFKNRLRAERSLTDELIKTKKLDGAFFSFPYEVHPERITVKLNSFNAKTPNKKILKDHYEEHGYQLKYPELPLIVYSEHNIKYFYPLEVLEIYDLHEHEKTLHDEGLMWNGCHKCTDPNCVQNEYAQKCLDEKMAKHSRF